LTKIRSKNNLIFLKHRQRCKGKRIKSRKGRTLKILISSQRDKLLKKPSKLKKTPRRDNLHFLDCFPSFPKKNKPRRKKLRRKSKHH